MTSSLLRIPATRPFSRALLHRHAAMDVDVPMATRASARMARVNGLVENASMPAASKSWRVMRSHGFSPPISIASSFRWRARGQRRPRHNACRSARGHPSSDVQRISAGARFQRRALALDQRNAPSATSQIERQHGTAIPAPTMATSTRIYTVPVSRPAPRRPQRQFDASQRCADLHSAHALRTRSSVSRADGHAIRASRALASLAGRWAIRSMTSSGTETRALRCVMNCALR